jgi:predicted transcriptional regulator YheO
MDIIIFIDLCLSARAQNNIQLLCININKTIIENMKFKFSFKSIEGETRYGSTNSLTWKTSSRTLVSLFSSWTTSTRPLGFLFKTDNQSTLDWSFLKKGVYV